MDNRYFSVAGVTSRCALMVMITVVAQGFAEPGGGQPVRQGTLALGEAFTRTLAPEASHVWALPLEKNQFAGIEVEQKGVDVVILVADPESAHIDEFDTPTGLWSTEKAFCVSSDSGTWSVRIVSLEAEDSAEYTIRLAELRDAARADRLKLEAYRYRRAAIVSIEEGVFARAESLFGLSALRWEEAVGPDHPEVGRSLNNIAVVCKYQGKYVAAESLYTRVLEVFEQSLGSDHPDVATALMNLANARAEHGRYAEADTMFRRALEIRERYLGPDHPDLAASLLNLACLWSDMGRRSGIEDLELRALAIREKNFGPDHPLVAEALNNLANLYGDEGRYAEAGALYRRSLAIRESALGPEHPDVAKTLHNLAIHCEMVGEHAQAESLYVRAIAIRETSLGPDHPYVARSLSNLGLLYALDSAPERAEPLFVRALAIRQAVFDSEHPEVAQSHGDLAHASLAQGEVRAALAHSTRRIEILSRILESDHPDVIDALTLHAEILSEIGTQESADSAFQCIAKAIGLLDSTPELFPEERARAYASRARMQKGRKELPDAIADLAMAVDAIEGIRCRVGGTEETRASFLRRHVDLYEQMVAWQLENGDAERALEYVERGRARALLDQLAVSGIDVARSIPAGERDALLCREEEARQAVAECQARLAFVQASADYPEATRTIEASRLKTRLHAAHQAYYEAYAALRNSSTLWSAIKPWSREDLPLSRLRERLVRHDGAVLIYEIGTRGSVLFFLPPFGTSLRVFPLVLDAEAAEILGLHPGPFTNSSLETCLFRTACGSEDRTVFEMLSSPRNEIRPDQGRSARLVSERLHALWRTLVPEEVWESIIGCREVLVIPDAGVHWLPFEALVLIPGRTDADATYWLDQGPGLRYASSLSTLHSIVSRRGESEDPTPGGIQVVSLYDPVFSAGEVEHVRGPESGVSRNEPGAAMASLSSPIRTRYAKLGGALERLPWTAYETAEIRRAFESSKKPTAVLTLSGIEATESRFREAVRGVPYLHLATHGLVDETGPSLFAALAMAPDVTAEAASDMDGFLQLFEIYDLPLSACKLAVLSACRSSVGRYVEGEGLFALSRGFLVAGADRVVASLWSVEDVSTAQLVGDFFGKIAHEAGDGSLVDYATALRDAKRMLRDDEMWSHPFYWAPFVLIGRD